MITEIPFCILKDSILTLPETSDKVKVIGVFVINYGHKNVRIRYELESKNKEEVTEELLNSYRTTWRKEIREKYEEKSRDYYKSLRES